VDPGFREELAMRPVLLLVVTALLLSSSVCLANPIVTRLDGISIITELIDHPANTALGADGRTVDIVGDTSNTASNTGRAKGNAYRVDVDTRLDEVEFWLNFTDTQTLIYYVFESLVEFGTYSEIYRDTEVVSGMGAGWYSTGTLNVQLNAGRYYIIAVSWDGYMTYYYDTGDSQATSFGSQVHGYAVGLNPLPSSFSSTVNDQAIYYQRLMSTAITPVENSTWGSIKALYR
jgi:hypothetical protein